MIHRPPSLAEAMPQPIRVAFVLDEITTPHAGTEQQLLMLLDRLDRDLVQPSVTVLRSSAFLSEWPVRACPTSSLNISSLKSPAAAFKLWQFSGRLRRLQVHIVHVLLNDAAIVVPLAARLGGAIVVAARRDLGFWHTPRLLRLLRLSNRFVDRIVVNSEAVLQSVAGAEKYPVDKMLVIRNGFDERRLALPIHDLRRALSVGDGALLVGVVANLHRWKRHGDLIRAVAQLARRGMDVHSVLIGEGPERDSLVSLAQTLGVTGRTHFLGSVPEPISHIKALDVAVLSSETEGASNALIEYLCCGVPVVLTDIPANRELAGGLEEAHFYTAGDVEGLACAIELQLESSLLSPGPTDTTGITARFGSRRMAAEYTALYNALCRPKDVARAMSSMRLG